MEKSDHHFVQELEGFSTSRQHARLNRGFAGENEKPGGRGEESLPWSTSTALTLIRITYRNIPLKQKDGGLK